MKRKNIIIMTLFALLLPFGAKAQIPVTDFANITQSIVNSAIEVAEATTTAKNMVGNFKETVKIYEQAKQYYDKLRSVNYLVKDALKVRNTILLVGEITELYIMNFQVIASDGNFTYAEIASIANCYAKLMKNSSELLQELKTITSKTSLSMTDKERMDVIDRIYYSVKRYRDMTSYYTRKVISISYLRSQKRNSTDGFLQLYGNAGIRYW